MHNPQRFASVIKASCLSSVAAGVPMSVLHQPAKATCGEMLCSVLKPLSLKVRWCEVEL